MKKDVVELYLEHGDFERAIKESGLSAISAHIKLINSGVITLKDKVRYSSRNGKLGAEAELLFQKIVPKAVNYNTVVKKNNPVFDFKYGDLTIDVKYSSVHKRGNHSFWNVRPSNADMLVVFLEEKIGSGLKNSEILVIPQAFIGTTKNLHITRNKELYAYCLVKQEELEEILAEYNGAK